MSESSVGHVPAKEKWEFDESVTAVFDDMLRRSIPQYDVMRGMVTALALDFSARGAGPIVDLGSSRGEAIGPLVEKIGSGKTFYSYEQSPPMLEALRERFKRPIAEGWVRVSGEDLRRPSSRNWSALRGSATLSVLTLQFVPINYRQAIVRDVFRGLAPGGAFILVEKVLGESSELDELFVAHYHGLKSSSGYGQEEIERKAMALEGVLVPVTASWNADLLRQAGFRQVDCFWACLNFRGWIAIKD